MQSKKMDTHTFKSISCPLWIVLPREHLQEELLKEGREGVRLDGLPDLLHEPELVSHVVNSDKVAGTWLLGDDGVKESPGQRK